MRQRDKIQSKYHYIVEPAWSIIYWSITLFILCLVIIISLETQKVTIMAIVLGIIFLLFLFLPSRNILYLRDTGLWCHSLLKKDYGFHFNEITKCIVRGHRLEIIGGEHHFIGYLTTKNLTLLIARLEAIEEINIEYISNS